MTGEPVRFDSSPESQMALFDHLDARLRERSLDGFIRPPWPGEGQLLGVPDCVMVVGFTTEEGFQTRAALTAWGDLVNLCGGRTPPWSIEFIAATFKRPDHHFGSLRVVR
jgi:hypothetical protein